MRRRQAASPGAKAFQFTVDALKAFLDDASIAGIQLLPLPTCTFLDEFGAAAGSGHFRRSSIPRTGAGLANPLLSLRGLGQALRIVQIDGAPAQVAPAELVGLAAASLDIFTTFQGFGTGLGEMRTPVV